MSIVDMLYELLNSHKTRSCKVVKEVQMDGAVKSSAVLAVRKVIAVLVQAIVSKSSKVFTIASVHAYSLQAVKGKTIARHQIARPITVQALTPTKPLLEVLLAILLAQKLAPFFTAERAFTPATLLELSQ
jgi:hypothetical protein